MKRIVEKLIVPNRRMSLHQLFSPLLFSSLQCRKHKKRKKHIAEKKCWMQNHVKKRMTTLMKIVSTHSLDRTGVSYNSFFWKLTKESSRRKKQRFKRRDSVSIQSSSIASDAVSIKRSKTCTHFLSLCLSRHSFNSHSFETLATKRATERGDTVEWKR